MSKQNNNEPKSDLGSVTLHKVEHRNEKDVWKKDREEFRAALRKRMNIPDEGERKRRMMERTDAEFRVLNSHFSEALQQQKDYPDLSKISNKQLSTIENKQKLCLGYAKSYVPLLIVNELSYKGCSEERKQLLAGMLERCRFISNHQLKYFDQSLLDATHTARIKSLKTKREIEFHLQYWRKELDNPRHENPERAAKMILVCQQALKRF